MARKEDEEAAARARAAQKQWIDATPAEGATLAQQSVTPQGGIVAQGVTPAQSATPAQGMPKTAVVDYIPSYGFMPAGPAVGGGDSLGSNAVKDIATPHGTIATTNPQGQARLEAEASNPLARDGAFSFSRNVPAATTTAPITTTVPDVAPRVEQAAQNYRDLVSRNASPGERAAARQNYAAALSEKAAQGRPVSVSQAFGMPQREVSPAERERIAHYNDLFPRLTQGQNPFMIGTSTLAHREGEAGGMNVMSRDEETAIRSEVNEQVKEAKTLLKAERRYKAKDEFDKAADARKQRLQLEFESGLKNPKNLKAGWDVDNAVKNKTALNELQRNASSLAGLAQQKITEQAVAKARQEAKEAESRKQMNDPQWVAARKKEYADAERDRLDYEEWKKDQEKKRQLSGLAYR